jgi:hypothetical protein
MTGFKANQVQQAIFWTLRAEGTRAEEIRFRLKRLFAADRSLGRTPRSQSKTDRQYAFFSDDPPGTGSDILFSEYEAFAALAAIVLLEHGLPQTVVVRLLRQVRPDLERVYAESRKKNPDRLFDAEVLLEQAKPGMIAFESTEPIILVFTKLTGSSVNDIHPAICVDSLQLSRFMRQHNLPGLGVSIFDFSRLAHELAGNLRSSGALKRGRVRSPERGSPMRSPPSPPKGDSR